MPPVNMLPHSRDQFHWVNTRYGTSCRLFRTGTEEKERSGGEGKKEGKEEGIIWFLIFVSESRHLVLLLLLFLYFSVFITFIYSTLRDF